MNLSESQIREDIFLSARRIVSGLEVAKREQVNLSCHIKALDKYGEHGAMSRMARDVGVSKQLFSEVLSGRKKVEAAAVRRMAKARI